MLLLETDMFSCFSPPLAYLYLHVWKIPEHYRLGFENLFISVFLNISATGFSNHNISVDHTTQVRSNIFNLQPIGPQ